MHDHDSFKLILNKATNVLNSLAQGDCSAHYEAISAEDVILAEAINQLASKLKNITKHLSLIAQGRYDLKFVAESDKDDLGFAISDMTDMLREMGEENKKSAYIKSGQAELLNIIGGNQSSYDLGSNIISFFARYINALVGSIYQVISEEEELELIGSFALPANYKIAKSIQLGEGLVGQCALEKQLLVFNDVPKEYMNITSSLVEITPKQIILVPFIIENEVIGVMELGSLEIFDETKLELLRQVSKHIAIALKSSQNNERIKSLLGAR